MSQVATMRKYIAYFDFTTVHSNGKFVGRSGQVSFESDKELLEVLKDFDGVQNMCVRFIHSQKPKWNILMITVTDIQNTNP